MPLIHLFRVLSLLALALLVGCSTTSTFSAYNAKHHPNVDTSTLALLEVPVELNVTLVDGYAPEISGFNNGPIQLQLLPGRHEITLEYEELFADQHSEGHITVSSNPVTLSAEVKPSGRYRLSFPAQTEVTAAMDYAKNPSVWIDDLGSGAKQENYVDASGHQGSLESPLERLQFWWKRADEQSRGEFLDWTRLYNDPDPQ